MPTQQIPLTRAQLKQLTEEYQDLEEWTIVRDFCRQAYGENKVARFSIETYGEYNDEGGTSYSIESITATDSADNEIEFDLNLPFWIHLQKENDLKAYQEEAEDEQDGALAALKDWGFYTQGSKELKAKYNWVAWEDLPCDDDGGTYDLTKQPTISFPVVIAV